MAAAASVELHPGHDKYFRVSVTTLILNNNEN